MFWGLWPRGLAAWTSSGASERERSVPPASRRVQRRDSSTRVIWKPQPSAGPWPGLELVHQFMDMWMWWWWKGQPSPDAILVLNLLRTAWVIQPRETLKQQAAQIREFSDLWYGKCVLQ